MASSKPVVRIGDLEINQDLKFQRRMWRAEAATRYAVVGILLLGLLGLWGGGGVFSLGHAISPQKNLRADFERFGRRQKEQELKITWQGTPSSETRLWLQRDGMEKLEVLSLYPAPMRSEWEPGRIVFVYPPAEGSIDWKIAIRPKDMGTAKITLGVATESLEFRQWIYP